MPRIEDKLSVSFSHKSIFINEIYLQALSDTYGCVTVDNLVIAFVVKKQSIFRVLSFT